jgi:hypothetical protein
MIFKDDSRAVAPFAAQTYHKHDKQILQKVPHIWVSVPYTALERKFK